jgi:putative ABC transport system permease protein
MQFRKEIRLSVRSLRNRQTEQVHLDALVLLGAVLAVLLIAGANVASLLLARAASRQRELAMRAALGAGRARLIRQTLTESLLLGVMGGAAGCALAEVLLRAFTAIAPRGIPRLEQAHLDLRVLAFALGVSLLCGILFGIVPALETPRSETLAGWHTVGIHRQRFRQALVTMQIAVSLVLLAGASLLLRSLWNLENERLGMRTAGVVTVAINLGQRYPEPARQLAFFEALESRLKQLPGVDALAVSDSLPPGGPMHGGPYAAIEVEGRPRFMEGTGGMVAWRSVTPDYFAALDIPILHGRSFTEADRNPDQHVIILSESLAQRLFPGQDPLGHAVRHGFEGPWFTVVGVTANVKNGGLAEPADPEYYIVRRHSAEDAASASQVILRTSTNHPAMGHWVRSEVAGLDPTLPVTLETMQQRVGTFSVQPRFDAAVLGLFALMGLLLAAVGIYGVIAFLVTQQTQEIGVRMALGATRGDVLKLFAGRGLRLITIGVALGFVSALALSRVLSSLLFGVQADDPATFAVAILGLAGVGLLASYIPARAATKIDPMTALRCE